MLTKQELTLALPPHLKAAATDDLLDLVNNISADPEVAETIRGNFISYTSVMKEGRFKTDDYLNAVAYVSYKMMGYNNQDAYARTFPVRYQALVAKGTSSKDISAYVAAYNKNKLVNLILEQTMIAPWILNQDVYQKAIKTQMDLMLTSKSDKVRSDAANSLLTHLKPPEKKQIQLSVDIAQNSGLHEMRELLHDLALKQQEMISNGVTTREIAHQPLVRKPSLSEILEAEVEEAVLASPHSDMEDQDGH